MNLYLLEVLFCLQEFAVDQVDFAKLEVEIIEFLGCVVEDVSLDQIECSLAFAEVVRVEVDRHL